MMVSIVSALIRPSFERFDTAQPLYFTDVAEKFAQYNFNTVARAIGHLHTTEKLWQDSRGRLCVRGSQFAATPPKK